jgi:hypothetical protein
MSVTSDELVKVYVCAFVVDVEGQRGVEVGYRAIDDA